MNYVTKLGPLIKGLKIAGKFATGASFIISGAALFVDCKAAGVLSAEAILNMVKNCSKEI